ncbi:MAG: chemotaxis protein CheW [Burkholderiaceae bacterium]|nr:chemotaxis protein CheW [Burkholderiaceae bacterium]
MSGTTSTPGGGSLDLSQFFQVFFEEAAENLERMEQLLLGIDLQAADDETLNAIFRCAHSVKGGAATFGFSDLADLTHDMETLLDRLRRRELVPSVAMVDVLLQSGDAMRAHLDRYRSGAEGNGVDDAGVRASLRSLAEGGQAKAATPVATPAAAPVAAPLPDAAGTKEVDAPVAAAEPRVLELVVGPLEAPEQADQLFELFREIEDLGTIERLDAGQAAEGIRRFRVHTTSSDADLLDLFTFHVDRERVRLQPISDGYGFHEGAPGAPAPQAATVDPQPFAPGAEATLPDASDADFAGARGAGPAPAELTVDRRAPAGAQAARAAASEASTLRVSVDKVDQLINLVGELVITQAMLAQNSARRDAAAQEQMAAGLADLERNTRNLQESVMSIRMIPMSVVFNRFPRMLRDLAGRLGKKVDFVTRGEATELDKGVVEKIIDPLTHLVRNSCDHGIELPHERAASGKAETGTISLAASHQGGSIVIEVCDDGRGLSRARLLAKARERGIEVSDAMPDADVWNLVFAPGFSTADAVTDVSGRGVGMDVVKKNIVALGGTVEIDSCEGRGMSVKVRLPLTLAIMDGMSVAVGRDCYIVPLASVVESFQMRDATVRTIGGGGRVVQVRDEYLPVVDLKQVFAVPAHGAPAEMPIMVVVESEGRRAALVVDALVGQQQVVVKNLETNYRRVDGISGATILGDGRVALILDVGSLARRASELRGASQWVH